MTRNPFLDPDREIMQGKTDEDILAGRARLEQDDEQEPGNAAVPSGSGGGGLVYAMGNEIWLYREHVDDILISTRQDWVRAFCVHEGRLYHAGAEGVIYDALSGKRIAHREGPVNALVSHAGRLYDGGEYDDIFDTLAGSSLADINSGKKWGDFRKFDHVHALCSHEGLLYAACGPRIVEVTSVREVAYRQTVVHALCSHDGKLYDGGFYENVRETLGTWESADRGDWVLTLCSHKGTLYDGGRYDGVFDTLSDARIPNGGTRTVQVLCPVGDTLYHALEMREIYNTSTGQMIVRHDTKNCEAMCSVDEALVDEIVKRFG